jgi:hypothetical protein
MKTRSLSRPFSAAFFAVINISCFAQWSNNPAINTPVCTFTGKQVDVRMTDDDHHGAFVTWKDSRTGVPDIYIQRVDSLGYTLWTTGGVSLCNNPADQSTPNIVSDMKGGAIVAWSDWRSGIERDIYAQRITKNGVIKWTFNGVVVSNKAEREHNEKIISDGVGGAIIVWEQEDTFTFSWDIWAQHIDSSGNALWPAGGIPVCTPVKNRLNPRVQKDGKGGIFVTLQEYNTDYDIYAQRIDKFGTRLWGAGGKLVCNATGTQTNPKIDPDSISKGIIIAWTDERNTIDYDIFAQRIDSAGNLLWGAAGKPVINFSGNQSAIDFLSNPKVGGSIFTWKDSRSGSSNNDIYAQKLDVNGTQQWPIAGVVICNSIRDQLNPNICGDGMGGGIIAWQDSSGGQWDIYSQRIDKNGLILWTTNGVPVGIATGEQTSVKNISDGAGGSIYGWQDKRTGTNDIYVHRIFYNGGNIGIEDQISFASANCFPNPFENNFVLNFNLAKEEKLSARIYNSSGIMVAELMPSNKTVGPGDTELSFNIEQYQLPAGFYFLELKGADSSKKIKLIKTK